MSTSPTAKRAPQRAQALHRASPAVSAHHPAASNGLPGQVVLVLQGGGALGAYQVGVYEALHEAGIEPDWVIGTSIGAINGALIAGNRPEHRLDRLNAFWKKVEHRGLLPSQPASPSLDFGLGNTAANLSMITFGVPAFFAPNPWSWLGTKATVGLDRAAYYSTAQLKQTLGELVDFDWLADGPTRLTVGAVNANSGAMRYFDSRDERLQAEHVMASGALPPAFAAVRIDGEPYWDGGIYSNTPIEAVLDDRPRRNSVIFAAQMWNPAGPEPGSIWDVMGRMKDIQFASRARSHIERQKQLHRLRHIVRELEGHLPDSLRNDPEVKELTAWGCGTTMHVIKLNAPRLPGEDQTKDIDFTARGIRERRIAGYEETLQVIADRPWQAPVDPIEGVMVHERDAAEAALIP